VPWLDVSATEPCPCGRLDARGRPLPYTGCCQPWHASTRPAAIDFEPGQRWLGLAVRQHRVVDGTHAEVEFVARSRLGGRGHRLHERSRFVREDGRWYYVDGDLFP